MTGDTTAQGRIEAWLAALDQRHLADLTPSEVARALRALSSCYVERRDRLRQGDALGTAGKRAAFALFYAPLHFFAVRHVVQSLPTTPLREVVDLGCGTGVAGAAWALDHAAARLSGFDRHPWVVEEANRTYRDLELSGRASRQDVMRVQLPSRHGAGIVAAYTVNELGDEMRAALLPRLLDANRGGAAVLVLEPIARRMSPWWTEWEEAFTAASGRSDEWRAPAVLPARQRALAKASGLTARELTARTLFLPGRGRADGKDDKLVIG